MNHSKVVEERPETLAFRNSIDLPECDHLLIIPTGESIQVDRQFLAFKPARLDTRAGGKKYACTGLVRDPSSLL